MKPLASETFPLTGHHLIEASAGTGKTYTITNLYLRLLLGRGEYPTPLTTSQILVLTFTIAATDELRQRIRDRIIKARAIFAAEVDNTDDDFIQYLIDTSDDPERDRKLLTHALQTMDEASVFTIHAFCARVLSEQSFETGTLFDQELDADKDSLLQMAAQDCFRDPILTLSDFNRAIALKLWRTPEALLNKIKPYLFRHNLSIIPQAQDVEVELESLFTADRLAKQVWLEKNISDLVAKCNFSGNSTTVRRLEKMNERCASPDFDITLWEPYHQEKLKKSTKMATILPQHQVFDLIESIWQRANLVKQMEYCLWHQAFNKIKDNLNHYKTQFGQFTFDDLLTTVHAALSLDDDLLASQLRLKWPIAMIDEFQDTDDLQYEIFNKIYPDHGSPGLFFIGDPKQAIYRFRGADIYTYINAKRHLATEVFSLTTNWRSTPALVKAINHLFLQPDIFGDDKDIAFEAATAAEANKDKSFTIDGLEVKPISVFSVAHSSQNIEPTRRFAMEYAAEQIACLLNAATRGEALINKEPLIAGQIAILVRERRDAVAARGALARRNIRSVYVTQDSVLLSDTADDLKLILQAVIDPANERAIKAALATRLMQTPVSEIDTLSRDIIMQQRVLQEFHEYHRLWATVAIAPMIEFLITRRHIAEKWFLQHDGERQITNLRHLAEILQQRSTVAPGMHRLIKWFSREKLSADTVAVEDRQLRLESDQHLVQIITMHVSKGLEYDIVMIPMAGFGGRGPWQGEPLLFHESGPDGSIKPVLDLSVDDANRQKHIDEDLNEDMRLLYVAITRARYKCYLGIPLLAHLPQTALGKLLHLSIDDASLQMQWPLPSELFDFTEAVLASTTQYQPRQSETRLVKPPEIPQIKDHWSMQSYSSLARLIHDKSETGSEASSATDFEPGFADDDAGNTNIRATDSLPANRFTFPRGPRVGVALHDLLERLDFAATRDELDSHCKRCIAMVGLADDEETWLPVLREWIIDVLETPMANHINFSLAAISNRRRLNELEFHFPMQMGMDFIQTLLAAGYLTPESELSIHNLKGMMTGYIDLVVEFEEKYYLIDYKSNDLGHSAAAYHPDALAICVKQHKYDLQYLIYSVALNRYLEQRLEDYRYSQHFGGVCYLFLRGMSGKPGAGVFVDHPDEALIRRLDVLLQ